MFFGSNNGVKPTSNLAIQLQLKMKYIVHEAGGYIVDDDCRAAGNLSFSVSCRPHNITFVRLNTVLNNEMWVVVANRRNIFGESHREYENNTHRFTVSYDESEYISSIGIAKIKQNKGSK